MLVIVINKDVVITNKCKHKHLLVIIQEVNRTVKTQYIMYMMYLHTI